MTPEKQAVFELRLWMGGELFSQNLSRMSHFKTKRMQVHVYHNEPQPSGLSFDVPLPILSDSLPTRLTDGK